MINSCTELTLVADKHRYRSEARDWFDTARIVKIRRLPSREGRRRSHIFPSAHTPTRTRVCGGGRSFTRVNLGKIQRGHLSAPLFIIPDVPCNILQTSLRAHATGSRPGVIKIADCVRIADVFLPCRCCFLFHSLSFFVVLSLHRYRARRENFYACKFLGDSMGEIGARALFIPQ